MRNGAYYINNSGSRWVVYKNGEKEKIEFQTESGKKIIRTAIFHEMFGNFSAVCISYKGKKINVLTDTVLPD